MEKNWRLKPAGDPAGIRVLEKAINVNEHMARLLIQRGITSYEEARNFFRPSLDDLHDPFLMKDMNRAIDRITTAIDRNEKILVYGDYDVDGTTSVALIYSFFRSIYKNIGYYIPDRYTEGYGISRKGVDFAAANNFSLVIALDCGIKAVDKIAYAGKKNVDFIVCDHHLPGDKIPDAVAILDPKQPDCSYPDKNLSGCGVGFKLLQGYARINDIPFENLTHYLDLVAVSIASDIVPITGENRILAYYGLKKLNENPGTGLKSILHLAGIKDKVIEVEDIVFRIGPRINAAGRIESGRKAVELLVEEDQSFARAMGEKIDQYNQERRKIDQEITREALTMLSEDPFLAGRKSTVLFQEHWHKGVVGIVASRLIEQYYKPTIILTESEGLVTGSARSVDGFDLYQALDACSDLLESFGGHMYAAGVTLKKENVDTFRNKFEEVVEASITDEMLVPRIDVDDEIDFSVIDEGFYRVLRQMSPFGPGNMTPVFVTRGVRDIGTGRAVGNNGDHLKLDLVQEKDPARPFPAIAFNQAHHLPKIGALMDICYTIEENSFRGNTTLQLQIKDIKPA